MTARRAAPAARLGRAAAAGLALALGLAAAPAAAQDRVVFSAAPLTDCLARGNADACIGAGSDRCMQATPGGDTTAGMTGCLEAELDWWDDRLNAAYQRLRAADRRDDAAMAGTGRPSRADALRDVQRAWIAWRDATCDYEVLGWWGGTGASPVYLACKMRLTGTQALWLEAAEAAL
jgi:uncharacterized protein YecT (DUF1311 family)